MAQASRAMYVKVAAVIAAERIGAQHNLRAEVAPAEQHAVLETTRNIALSLADAFAKDNHAFDRQRFYEAAGITDQYAATGVAE